MKTEDSNREVDDRPTAGAVRFPAIPMAAIALAPFVFSLVGCERSGGEADAEIRLAPVEVLEVKRASGYRVEQRYVGTVEARRSSRLAFELGGTLETVHFEEGETVEAGATLAEIDTDRLQARRNELEATREQAVATRDLAETTLKRFDALTDRRAVSEQERDEARERLETAEASIRQVDSRIETIEVDLEKSRLVAPFGGTLARRHVDEGAVVSPNQPVFELLETDRLEVRAGLSEEAVRGLKPGDEVAVRSASGEPASLTVLRILPRRDPRARTVDVILDLGAADLSPRDGDLVTVQRTMRIDESGFFLPRDSLTESTRGLWACFVAVADPEAGPEAHRLDRRDLEVLHEYADTVFVRGALKAGDWVLSTGLQKIAPGQRVRIIEVESAESDPTTVAKGNDA